MIPQAIAGLVVAILALVLRRPAGESRAARVAFALYAGVMTYMTIAIAFGVVVAFTRIFLAILR